jgi:LD-carboxypeptidase N-terminal domain
MARLAKITGLVPGGVPTTRRLGASAQDRAPDLNAAFADPEVRAVLATIGGEDQITVVPHLDPEIVRGDPKPFLGFNDNTNVLNWLWNHGVAGFYGGSTPGAPRSGSGRGRGARQVAAGRRADRGTPGDHRAGGVPGRRSGLEDSGGAERVRRSRAHRAVDLGRSRDGGDRPHLGRVRRGGAVDPDGRTFPCGPVSATGRGPAAGDLRGTHPRSGVRPDPAFGSAKGA